MELLVRVQLPVATPMKKIAQGLQYKVYDIGNDRILKKTTNNAEMAVKLISWGELNIKKLIREAIDIRKKSIEGLLNLGNIDPKILGNPKFLQNLSYEQDKVISVEDYMASHTVEENKRIIDKYIENIFETWKFGFADIVYNFTINNGVNLEGKVILIDLGELSFSKEEVGESIKNKKWLTRHSYKTLKCKDKELEQYFKETMEEMVTLSSLDKYWSQSQ